MYLSKLNQFRLKKMKAMTGWDKKRDKKRKMSINNFLTYNL